MFINEAIVNYGLKNILIDENGKVIEGTDAKVAVEEASSDDIARLLPRIYMDSFEAEYTFSTERTQVMLCRERNGVPFSGVVEVSGDDYWLYRERIR